MGPLEEEYNIFLTRLDEMMQSHSNEFVLIKGSQIVTFCSSYEQALREGLNRFGNVPFFIKAVQKEEEVHIFYHGVS